MKRLAGDETSLKLWVLFIKFLERVRDIIRISRLGSKAAISIRILEDIVEGKEILFLSEFHTCKTL